MCTTRAARITAATSTMSAGSETTGRAGAVMASRPAIPAVRRPGLSGDHRPGQTGAGRRSAATVAAARGPPAAAPEPSSAPASGDATRTSPGRGQDQTQFRCARGARRSGRGGRGSSPPASSADCGLQAVLVGLRGRRCPTRRAVTWFETRPTRPGMTTSTGPPSTAQVSGRGSSRRRMAMARHARRWRRCRASAGRGFQHGPAPFVDSPDLPPPAAARCAPGDCVPISSAAACDRPRVSAFRVRTWPQPQTGSSGGQRQSLLSRSMNRLTMRSSSEW